MAYDEEVANRVRELVHDESGVGEQRMFGGLAFLIDGHMAVTVSGKGGLLLRVDPAQTDVLCAKTHVDRAVMGGREMNGWLRIGPGGIDTDEELAGWVQLALAYARTLPPK